MPISDIEITIRNSPVVLSGRQKCGRIYSESPWEFSSSLIDKVNNIKGLYSFTLVSQGDNTMKS
jgi:hypothetical protein